MASAALRRNLRLPQPRTAAARWRSYSRPVDAAASSGGGGGGCIEKILIANRGEIACRIIRTARRLGIQTVAVYSDADRDSLHSRSADEAVWIGPPPARASYLNAAAIVDAAKRTGAQAIHPGYGFLSENADFAKLCEDQGLTFIGPPASAIRDMGDKSASKRIMGAAGVPLVPGYHGSKQDIDFMKLEADKIGYPVLIKPTHGGGGKGMRIVHGPEEFVDSFLSAQREAAASFGTDTILLEKYITRPRHIEVQIFGDKHGNVIHLNERDCSVQRRHQKIIEEAPAPNITEEFRTKLGEAAVAAAKAVFYHSAGTVEFIVDTLTGEFYFMEMNTRLQVEHPVTEMIVGQDLVEWQIRVANGELLPLAQSEVPLLGHAFEARIYAENVPKGFLPAAGILHHYRPVSVSPSVRVETGVEEGNAVSLHYDPMIAKLVVSGANRSAALMNMRSCLAKFQVAGLPTNINFLQTLARHWAFESGQVETHFIDHFKDDLFMHSQKEIDKKTLGTAKRTAAFAASCICNLEQLASQKSYAGRDNLLSLWYAQPPFRLNHHAKNTMELQWEREFQTDKPEFFRLEVTYNPNGSYFIEYESYSRGQMHDDDSPGLQIKVIHLGDLAFRVAAENVCFNVNLAQYNKDHFKYIHVWCGEQHHLFRQTIMIERSSVDGQGPDHKSNLQTVSHSQGSMLAPMAGLVVKVLVKDQEKVTEGQPLIVLEAMKMEHVVRAPTSGRVCGLLVSPGEQIADSSVLLTIKDESG